MHFARNTHQVLILMQHSGSWTFTPSEVILPIL